MQNYIEAPSLALVADVGNTLAQVLKELRPILDAVGPARLSLDAAINAIGNSNASTETKKFLQARALGNSTRIPCKNENAAVSSADVHTDIMEELKQMYRILHSNPTLDINDIKKDLRSRGAIGVQLAAKTGKLSCTRNLTAHSFKDSPNVVFTFLEDTSSPQILATVNSTVMVSSTCERRK